MPDVLPSLAVEYRGRVVPLRVRRGRVSRWLLGGVAQLVLLAAFLLGALAPARAVPYGENESKQEERNEIEEEVEAIHAIAQRRGGHRTARGASTLGAVERVPRTIEPTRVAPDVRRPTALPRRTAPPDDEADLG